jgi:hypothetical protein
MKEKMVQGADGANSLAGGATGLAGMAGGMAMGVGAGGLAVGKMAGGMAVGAGMAELTRMGGKGTPMHLRSAKFGGLDLTRPAGQGLGGKNGHWYTPRRGSPHVMALSAMAGALMCSGVAAWGALTPDWCKISTRLSLSNPTSDVDINVWKGLADVIKYPQLEALRLLEIAQAKNMTTQEVNGVEIAVDGNAMGELATDKWLLLMTRVNECGARSNCDKCVDATTEDLCGWCLNPGEPAYCTFGDDDGPEPALKTTCMEWTRKLLSCPGTLHWKFGIFYSCKAEDEAEFTCFANVGKGGPCFLMNIEKQKTNAEQAAQDKAAATAEGLDVIQETPEQIAENARIAELAKNSDSKSDDLCYWKETDEKERCQVAIQYLCGGRTGVIQAIMLSIPSCGVVTFMLAFFVGWEWLCSCGAPFHIYKLRLVIFSVMGAFTAFVIFIFYFVSMSMFNGIVEKITIAFEVRHLPRLSDGFLTAL